MSNDTSLPSKILITGVAGFIGFHLARELLNNKWQVIGIDSVNDYYDVSLKEDRLKILYDYPDFSFHHIDLADQELLRKVFNYEEIDNNVPIVHLAAQAGVRYGLKNPQAYIHSNIIGFFNLIEQCKITQTPHLLYASSSSVYGNNHTLPFSEQDNVDRPVSLYAATKKSNELLAHVYSYTYNIPTTGLRFFTVYGPWGRPDMAYFLFTKAIIEGSPINVFNYGNMRRDFTYIDDIIDGISPLIAIPPQVNPDSNNIPYRIFNIGNHRSESLMEFIAVLERCLNRKAIIEMLPMQTGDVQATYADIKSLQNEVGFTPKTSIDEGIPRFVNWYLKYYHSN